MGQSFNTFGKNNGQLLYLMPSKKKWEFRVQILAFIFLHCNNGTVMRSDVLLLRLIWSNCDEKRRQSFPSFGGSLFCARVSPRVYLLSNISTLSTSFIRPFGAVQTGEVVSLNRIRRSCLKSVYFLQWLISTAWRPFYICLNHSLPIALLSSCSQN